MTMFRPYQIEAQVAVRDAWALSLPGDPHPMIVLATGTGKTETALGLVVDTVREGGRVVWLAHREELVTEPCDRFARGWPEFARRAGIVQAGRNEHDRQVVFGSIPTLASGDRLDQLLAHGDVDLVVVDEAHHSPSRSHAAVIDRLLAGGARALALTATPDRDDGLDLGERWEIVYAYGIVDAIRDGWLVPPFAVVKRLPDLDLSKVSGRRDYDDAELGAALLAAKVVEHTVEVLAQVHHAARLPAPIDREGNKLPTETRFLTAQGRGVLVFTATVEQAVRTAEALRGAGWKAYPISGETPKDERRRLIRAFRRGDIDVLCNAAVLTEGTDLPRASCLVLARPTRSWSLFTQMIGRGLRLFGLPKTHPGNNALHPEYAAAGGKGECLVIDLAGATEEHSLIAAPVLIGGSRCPKSPNGQHVFEPRREAGICTHCQKKVACFAAVIAGGPGGHEWGETAHCKRCGRPQCAGNPDESRPEHVWIPDFDAEKPRRACMHCEATVADPLGSMIGERSSRNSGPPPKAAWLRLRDLEPQTIAVHLDEHGSLYVVAADDSQGEGDDDGSLDGTSLWRPFWIPRRGRRARAITPGPIPGPDVRPIVADLVRKAAKVRDPRDPHRELHGGYGHAVRAELTERAVKLGIARLRTASPRSAR